MKRYISLVVVGCLLLTGSLAAYGEEIMLFDRSCNALQHVQQEARLKQMESVKAEGAEQYRQTLAGFKTEMDALFKESAKLEERYNAIRNTLDLALIKERGDLVERYREALARERPDLVIRAQQGDANADREFRDAVYAKLEKDLEFSAELRSRLSQDKEASQIAAEAFKLQVGQFHELEAKMAINRWKAPPDVEAGQVLKQKTEEFVAQQGYQPAVQRLLSENRAFTDLMTVVAAGYNGRHASLESQYQDGSMALRDRFDTPGKDARVDLAEVPPVLGTPITRELLGKLEAGRLQTDLDLYHTGQHAPTDAAERGAAMRDRSKPITAPIAETVGVALQRYKGVREGYERLSKFKKPEPPEVSSSPESVPAKVQSWAVQIATNLETAAKRIRFVLLDDKNLEDDDKPKPGPTGEPK